MIKSYKPLFIISAVTVLAGCLLFCMFYNIIYAGAFLAGFLIIMVDLLVLARYININVSRKQQFRIFGFIYKSIIRWAFIGICICISLVVLSLNKWPFIIGLILPFIIVFIIGAYQILIEGKGR